MFTTNDIIKINLATSSVEKIYDMSLLANINMQREKEGSMVGYDYGNNVLNGIALDLERMEFYLTGKRWNFIYKVKFD